MEIIKGKSAYSGVAIGKILVFKQTINKNKKSSLDKKANWESYLEAKAKADSQLEIIYLKAKKEVGEDQAEIIEVQRLMLQDDDFNDEVENSILKKKKSAIMAVEETGEQFSLMFSSMDDEYMKERALDVLDITKRLMKILSGDEEQFNLSEPVIIIADDLTPTETLQMDRSKILAFVTKNGSANSHTAILAGALNIPSLIQTDIELDEKLNGTIGIVDGQNGLFYLNPDVKTLETLKKEKEVLDEKRQELLELKDAPTTTKGGRNIMLFANAGNTKDIASILENGAEGIGLFRSEFLFLGSKDYPTEEQQYKAYKEVITAMEGKKVIIRTLDIGADKKVDYFNLTEEENPALGFRAIRICLERPELFKTQLRAIYRAAVYGNVSIMFPMITSVWEIRECKKIIAQVTYELAKEGIPVGEVEVGIMVETPAVVMIADEMAKEVDFFSVGTNDLTQYTLAIDRQSSELDRFYDPYHPAIITMLEMIATAAKKGGIWAGICGELGADLSMTETFVKMGYTELSVSPSHILPVRRKIRSLEIN